MDVRIETMKTEDIDILPLCTSSLLS